MDQEELNRIFLEEAEQNLMDWEELCLKVDLGNFDEEVLKNFSRLAHNLKGAAQTSGYDLAAEWVHRSENLINNLKTEQPNDNTHIITLLLAAEKYLRGLIFIDEYGAPSAETTESLERNFARIEKTLPSVATSLKSFKAGLSAMIFGDEEGEQPKEPSTSASDNKVNISADIDLAEDSDQAKAGGEAKKKVEYIRVPLNKLDTLVNLVGELTVDQSFLQERRHLIFHDRDVLRTISKLNKNINEVRTISMSMRMIPLKQLFQVQQRTVRDAAKQLNKKVEMICDGDWVELDKIIVDDLKDPLTHLLRNAVDHGLEDSSEARVKAGKPEVGRIDCKAVYQDDKVVLTVSDDGEGIDTEAVWQKALKMGVVSDQEVRWSDERINDLIFYPGFSTKSEVSMLSGRGVGMDVLKQTISRLKGTIHLSTQPGKGTTFTITLPLSLSIVEGLVVSISAERYVIPISQLVKTIHFHKVKVQTCSKRGRMVYDGGESIPLISISEVFGLADYTHGARPQPKIAVVTADGAMRVALEVDEVLGQQSVVLKALTPDLMDIPGLMAGTVLNDGEPSLVLNLNGFKYAWKVSHAA